MSYRHWLFSAVLFGTMMSTLSVSVSAKELAPNSADLQYSVNVPTMQIAINPGGGGCVGVETWDPTAGKCTEAEYIRDTVRVVQVSPSPATVASDGTASILSATVRDGLGRLAPAGIEVLWSATLGTLTTTRSITNSSGVAFASISSKVAGASTIYAKTTVSGNASTGVTFKAMNPVINSFTSTCNQKGKIYGYAVCYDASQDAYSYTNTLSWSVNNAVRYTVSNGWSIIYSGAGNSLNLNGVYYGNWYSLTAYSTNSSDSPSTTIQIEVNQLNTDPGSQNGS